jgi:hypothetical protein
MPPPQEPESLELTVEAFSLKVAVLKIPPPSKPEVLPLMVERFTSISLPDPTLAMPPPKAPRLSLTVERLSVRVPTL